jgi:hypothetical protein
VIFREELALVITCGEGGEFPSGLFYCTEFSTLPVEKIGE